LTIQWGGIAIVTILSFLMAQSVRRQFLEYWTLSWACRMLSLTSLLIAFSLPYPPKIFYTIYFLAEYGFAYLVVSGCRNHARGAKLAVADCWVLIPAVLVAVALPYLSSDLNTLLVPFSATLVLFWVAAYRFLEPRRQTEKHSTGMRVVRVALVMLTLNSFHYVAVYGYGALTDEGTPFAYLKYAALYDLLLEMLLAFGTVIYLLESVCRQLEGEKHVLAAAGVQLQTLAERDPLTEALNRHAFYSFLQKSNEANGRTLRGSLALVDVDDFKSINDTLGHATGDAAIRAVAESIRSVIRADDKLFRWGGDEFLILLVGLAEAEARTRLNGLNRALRQTQLTDSDSPIDLLVSYGVAEFQAAIELEQTIEIADREMYNHKQARKVAQPRLHLSAGLNV
jgi:diguanylate cyclase (GGDEF)-like protein